MDAQVVAKSDQEQAVAAWVSYLNQVRIDRMLAEFHKQDLDLEKAVEEMAEAVRRIDMLIEKNRGSYKGIHGYIAEAAEVGIQNAKRLVQGESATYKWQNDNGPVDTIRAGQDLQMKFSNSRGTFSLSAVLQHAEKYPSFISEGGRYVIPRDHYDMLQRLSEMPEPEASHLVATRDGISYGQWRKVRELLGDGKVSMGDLEPAETDYGEVQVGTVHETMDGKANEIREQHRVRHDASYEKSRPTMQEGARATAAAAAIEGGAAFAMAIASKVREGKRIRELDANDWMEIAGESGKGFARGGVRGASVYFLTNFTATSAAVTSSLVTASFGVAEQAHRMRQGHIDEAEFLEQSELLCLDATVSAVSSFIGQAVIPIPVLGAVIGNTVGNVLYQIAKDGLSEREQAIVRAYAEAQHSLDAMLDARYQALLSSLYAGMREYLALLENAMSPDPLEAFEGSISLAKSVGVPEDEVLASLEDIDDFFLT